MKFISKGNSTKIEKLIIGDVFIYNNEVFMKTKVDDVFCFYEIVNDSPFVCTWGVSLQDGLLVSFDYGTVVEPIKAEMHEV